jgi:hypothetical protein
MARNDDNALGIVILGIGAYFLYQYFKMHGFNFSATGGAPGPLPFGGGGTEGGQGGIPGGTTGSGASAPATSSAPSPVGAGAGTLVCVDDQTGEHFATLPDGTCPVGSTLTLAVNVTQ